MTPLSNPEATREPLRPPLQKSEKTPQVAIQPGSDQKRAHQISTGVSYPDPETGQPIQVVHPEIVELEKNQHGPFDESSPVKITVGGRILEVNFRNYLQMLGTSYADYRLALRGHKASDSAVFKTLHGQALQGRLLRAKSAERETGQHLNRQENNRNTKIEIEAYLGRLINESGYGEFVPGSLQNDHSDKIDFLLKLDPAKIPGQKGEMVYLGVP